VDAVFKSLKKQSNLLRAMDNIAPKAAREGNNIVLRGLRNVLSVIQMRGTFNQFMASIVGVGGLGASAMFAPMFTGGLAIGMFGYVGTKVVISPATKKGLALLLKEMDRLLVQPGKLTAKMAAQLRLDRAALAELLKTSEVNEEENGDL